MDKEEARRKKRLSVYEFSSLNEENGFSFLTEQNRQQLEKTLTPEKIFNLHTAKFMIWEKFGLIPVVLAIAYTDGDAAAMLVKIPEGKEADEDEHWIDLPGVLYYPYQTDFHLMAITQFLNKYVIARSNQDGSRHSNP